MRQVVAATVALVFLPSAAFGTEQVRGFDTGGILITDTSPGSPGQPAGSAPPKQGSPVYAYWAIVYTPDGFCRERRFTTDQAEADAYNYVYELRVAEANELTRLESCPADTSAAAPPTPGELARDFWDVRLLPSPTVKTVPDYAIVGKRVYLQIVGPPTTAFDVPNPIGADIDIQATSRYAVDWGDGTPPTTTTSQGGPWPDGDLTHVYDTAHSAVTIRVTQQWSATWTAGPGTAGTLDDLRTVGELTIRVDQLQPVRNK